MNNMDNVKRLDKVIKQAEQDSNIERIGGVLFNSFCKSCTNDCRRCIGFDLACLLDGVISDFENMSSEYDINIQDYKQAVKAYKGHKSENGGVDIAPVGVSCAVHAEAGIDEVQYSSIDKESITKLSNDITSSFFDSKKSGRVIVDKVKVTRQIVKHIKRNIRASDVGGYKLIGLVLTYCGLYAIMTKDEYCHYDKIKIIIKSVVSVNDCVLFNLVTDRSSDFQSIEPNNTVIFYSDQIDDLQGIRFFRHLPKCDLV